MSRIVYEEWAPRGEAVGVIAESVAVGGWPLMVGLFLVAAAAAGMYIDHKRNPR